VPKFPRDESLAFLQHRIGASGDDADALADALGDLPLALEQAAAYLDATGASLADYLSLFRTRRRELWDSGKPPPAYGETVGTTWVLSMDSARKQCPACGDLLALCAFLAPDDIPLSLLRDGAPHLPRRLRATTRDPIRLNRATAALLRYSLLQLSADSLSLHRLVQAVAQDRLSQQDQRTYAEAAARLVNKAFPFDSDDVRTWPQCSRLLPHALAAAGHAADLHAALDAAGRLLNQSGIYLQGRAQFAHAKQVLQCALAIYEKAHGPDHPNVAIRLNNLGGMLCVQGDLEGARIHGERALAIYDKFLGPDHPDTVLARNNLQVLDS
jgi:tetratricopeptide (TPR) repeat protein